MLYSKCKKNLVDLEEIGGNYLASIEDLVAEIRRNRRDKFLSRLFSIKSGDFDCSHCFDGITFFAVLEEHVEYGDLTGKNYEGKILYKVTAGDDWTWEIETDITWSSALPIVGGAFHYVTRILSKSDEVVDGRIHAMTGTSLKVKVIENDIHTVSTRELLIRDGLAGSEND